MAKPWLHVLPASLVRGHRIYQGLQLGLEISRAPSWS